MEPDRARVRPIGAGVHRHLTPAIVALLILAGVARGALSGVLPLYDTTEGRYGSVAVAMHDTGNLVTPVLRVGGVPAPYWGKPPLAFWLMDASFHLFGVNEFGARFPALLCGALMLWLVFRGGKAIGGTETGLLSALVLASSILFLVIAGAVTLDMAASLCVTGIVISYLMIGLLPEGAAGAWKVHSFPSPSAPPGTSSPSGPRRGSSATTSSTNTCSATRARNTAICTARRTSGRAGRSGCSWSQG